MSRQDYLKGSWRRLARPCQLKTLEDLSKYAYEYTYDCNTESHQCLEEEDICRRWEMEPALWHEHDSALHCYDCVCLHHAAATCVVLTPHACRKIFHISGTSCQEHAAAVQHAARAEPDLPVQTGPGSHQSAAWRRSMRPSWLRSSQAATCS